MSNVSWEDAKESLMKYIVILQDNIFESSFPILQEGESHLSLKMNMHAHGKPEKLKYHAWRYYCFSLVYQQFVLKCYRV